MEELNKGGDLMNKKILVFDEYKGDPERGAFRVPVQYNDQMRVSNNRLEQATIMVKNFIGNGENIYALGGHGSRFNGNMFGAHATNVFSRLRNPESDHHKDIARSVHGNEGLELMEKLKEIGRQAGSELRKQNKLEER